MEWPYRRFIKAFSIWQRRRIGEAVDRRRDLHIAAIHSNTNWDSEENDRQAHLEALDNYYESLKMALTEDPEIAAREEVKMREMEENDPFLRAGKKQIQIMTQITEPGQSQIDGW